jgi:hypothetical protein
MYEQLLDQDREQGHRLGMAEDLANLAMVAVHRGASERARALLREALAIGDQVDNKMHVLSVLDICGSIAALTHEWVCAARFHGAARKLMEQIHFRREPVDDAVILPRIAVVRDALGFCGSTVRRACAQPRTSVGGDASMAENRGEYGWERDVTGEPAPGVFISPMGLLSLVTAHNVSIAPSNDCYWRLHRTTGVDRPGPWSTC